MTTEKSASKTAKTVKTTAKVTAKTVKSVAQKPAAKSKEAKPVAKKRAESFEDKAGRLLKENATAKRFEKEYTEAYAKRGIKDPTFVLPRIAIYKRIAEKKLGIPSTKTTQKKAQNATKKVASTKATTAQGGGKKKARTAKKTVPMSTAKA